MATYKIKDQFGTVVDTILSDSEEWVSSRFPYYDKIEETNTPVEKFGRNGMKLEWCITKRAFYRRLTAAERATAPFKKLMEEYFLDDFIYLKENTLEADVLAATGDQVRADDILTTRPKTKELFFDL
jgi:hypothetical protein